MEFFSNLFWFLFCQIRIKYYHWVYPMEHPQRFLQDRTIKVDIPAYQQCENGGFNNKIRWLIKQAYGFRDREYFKLKIY